MTNQEAIKMLTAKVECIRRETSGTDIDCNLRNCDDCELCYAQGTTGEQREALNMAISALRAQEAKTQLSAEGTTSDCISRQAAIDLCDWYDNPSMHDDLEKLPSAQPEPQWIPCSKRLPESKPEDLEYPTVIACCEDGEVMTACYYESTKEWGTGENYDKKINPVAWMPLPEPYQEEMETITYPQIPGITPTVI